MKLTNIERRLLGYLDQHGATHREKIVAELAAPDSKWARGVGGHGSNGAAPLILGKWGKRLEAAGLLVVARSNGFYRFHEITQAGRKALRDGDAQ